MKPWLKNWNHSDTGKGLRSMSGEKKESMQKIGLFIAGVGVAVSLLLGVRSYADLPDRVTKVEVKVEVAEKEIAAQRAEIGERLARIEAMISSLKESVERRN